MREGVSFLVFCFSVVYWLLVDSSLSLSLSSCAHSACRTVVTEVGYGETHCRTDKPRRLIGGTRSGTWDMLIQFPGMFRFCFANFSQEFPRFVGI